MSPQCDDYVFTIMYVDELDHLISTSIVAQPLAYPAWVVGLASVLQYCRSLDPRIDVDTLDSVTNGISISSAFSGTGSAELAVGT
eukprot:7239755-Pyramimonas_sp.AAC.1